MNLNKVFVLGRVTRDPELKALENGRRVVSFGIATNKVWKDKDGNNQETVEFHNIVFWEKQAEVIAQYVQKGYLLLVEGRLQTRTWEKEGVKQYRTEIIGEAFQLPPKSMSGAEGRSGLDIDSIERDEDSDYEGQSVPKTPSAKKKYGGASRKVDNIDGEINPEDIPF